MRRVRCRSCADPFVQTANMSASSPVPATETKYSKAPGRLYHGFERYSERPKPEWYPLGGYVPKEGEWFWWQYTTGKQWERRMCRNGWSHDSSGESVYICDIGDTGWNRYYKGKMLPATPPLPDER